MPRYTIDMDDKFEKTLRDLAVAQGGTTADVIQRAVVTYKYLKSQVPDKSSPNRVSITDANGNVRTDVVLP